MIKVRVTIVTFRNHGDENIFDMIIQIFCTVACWFLTIFECNATACLHVLLPAEKGGLRTVDVSQCVGQSVCCSFDFQLNFTIVMGSFIQKHVLNQTGQSESRESMYGPIQTGQSGSREGMCGHKLTNQNFFDNFTMQGYKR